MEHYKNVLDYESGEIVCANSRRGTQTVKVRGWDNDSHQTRVTIELVFELWPDHLGVPAEVYELGFDEADDLVKGIQDALDAVSQRALEVAEDGGDAA
jgi:hypothetical protein